MLAYGECVRPLIGGDCRAAKDSRVLSAPQLGASFVGELPDTLACAGCCNVQEIVRTQSRENPVLVVSEIGTAADIPVDESAIGKRQSVLFGLASVAVSSPSRRAEGTLFRVG